MTPPTLLKTSPLCGIYRRYPVQTETVAGWQIARHFGHPQREAQQLQTAVVLADWSHIGKLMVSGTSAPWLEKLLQDNALLNAAATQLPQQPLSSYAETDGGILQLTATDRLILTQPGREATLLPHCPPTANVLNLTGAMACLALAGPRRHQVLERSTAIDLRLDHNPAGTVLQTTIHTIRCTLFRTTELDLILCPRTLAESLFDGLIDVGLPLGLMPTGLEILPVSFTD